MYLPMSQPMKQNYFSIDKSVAGDIAPQTGSDISEIAATVNKRPLHVKGAVALATGAMYLTLLGGCSHIKDNYTLNGAPLNDKRDAQSEEQPTNPSKEKEKTWLGKYWPYVVGGLLAIGIGLALSGGGGGNGGGSPSDSPGPSGSPAPSGGGGGGEGPGGSGGD